MDESVQRRREEGVTGRRCTKRGAAPRSTTPISLIHSTVFLVATRAEKYKIKIAIEQFSLHAAHGQWSQNNAA